MTLRINANPLEAAFQSTIYRVSSPDGCFDLRIGLINAAFDSFLRARGAASWGIITAFNPGAIRLAEEENASRQARLQALLAQEGWAFLAACNLDVRADWPPEPSYLVLQMAQARLCMLAFEFSQSAVVWGETGQAPSLLWL
jgi:hypothetical protein